MLNAIANAVIFIIAISAVMYLIAGHWLGYDLRTRHGIRFRLGDNDFMPPELLEACTEDALKIIQTMRLNHPMGFLLPMESRARDLVRDTDVVFTHGRINWFGDFKVEPGQDELLIFKTRLVDHIMKRAGLGSPEREAFFRAYLKARETKENEKRNRMVRPADGKQT